MKPRALAVAAVAALGIATLWWWAQAESDGVRTTSAAGTLPAVLHGTPPSPRDDVPQSAPGAGGNTAGDPFLSPDLRMTLEAMLLEAGDVREPAELKKRLAALVARHFPSAHATRALALAERYVDYRVALGALKAPVDTSDPRALRSALQARQQVRQHHFSAEEAEALFGSDAALDRYTLARLEIERNAQLNAEQKQKALREAEQEFDPEQRQMRQQAVAAIAVTAQTAAFDAQGTGDNERYAQRRAQYGEEAAQRLAKLDSEERDWQARLGQYALARTSQPPEQLAALRQRLFSESEQLRLDAALAARAQNSPARQ